MDNKNDLREESINFAVAVSDACENTSGISIYVNQLLHCSSSIGARQGTVLCLYTKNT